MNDSTPVSGHPFRSDERMDQLLRTFFRQEVPQVLAAGIVLPESRQKSAAVDLAPAAQLQFQELPAQGFGAPQTRRPVLAQFAVAGTLAAVVVSLFLVGNSARRPAEDWATRSAAEPAPATQHADEDLMLVSPGATSADTNDENSRRTALGNNGVTLEEAEGVDLNPSAQPRQE